MKLYKDYWDLRRLVAGIIPRRSQLETLEKQKGLVKEKGRKVNYQEFSFEKGQYEIKQRLLNKEEITSFLEVSLRAAHCPMPLNADVWDGLYCSFGCKYCFADSFRSSLYTSFFDNSKSIGLRSCKPSYFREEMDKLMKFRGREVGGNNELNKAISLQIPIRLGIRFEDFLPIEAKMGISLDFMRYLAEQNYPIMVNTKSGLIGTDPYVRALADNKAGAAVHMTMISSDEVLNKKLEPGAPPFLKRIEAAKALTAAGVRVVARIEPLMVFINDTPEDVAKWVSEVARAGITNITFDTYSFSASAPGVQRQMEVMGYDFKRMFYLMSDSQWLGSLLLGEFMKMMKEAGFSTSTFDFGNSPINNMDICCEVEDIYTSKGGGFSWGNNIIAARFIQRNSPNPVTWAQYNSFVEEKGGWLSESLMNDVRLSWNLLGNPAYFPDWSAGIEPMGTDLEGNRVWKFTPESDFRLDLLENLVRVAG